MIVDVCINQGGCVAPSSPTSHSNPVFLEHGVLHYGVPDRTGAYPRASTIALTTSTLPYAMALADHGLDALQKDTGFAKGINVLNRTITCRAVAEALGRIDAYRQFTLST